MTTSCLSPVSLTACSPRPPLDLSCNNEIAFHSDGAAGGLKAQRVIKGLVALISGDPPWMAAITLCQHGDLHHYRCILDAPVAAGHQGLCPLGEAHWQT